MEFLAKYRQPKLSYLDATEATVELFESTDVKSCLVRRHEVHGVIISCPGKKTLYLAFICVEWIQSGDTRRTDGATAFTRPLIVLPERLCKPIKFKSCNTE